MKDGVCWSLRSVLFGLIVIASAANAVAQVQVTPANSSNAMQRTVDLNAIVKGNRFKKDSKAQSFISDTTNLGGETVKSTGANAPGQLAVNMTAENSKHARKSNHTVVRKEPKPARATQPIGDAVGHCSLGSMHAFPRLSGFILPRR